MARFSTELQPATSAEQAVEDAKKYLTGEGFKAVQKGGENVWKKGMGLMLGPQFLRVEPSGDKVRLEAWIKFALLPGVYLGEMGIEGAFAMIPKKKLKKRVEAIQELVTGTNPSA